MPKITKRLIIYIVIIVLFLLLIMYSKPSCVSYAGPCNDTAIEFGIIALTVVVMFFDILISIIMWIFKHKKMDQENINNKSQELKEEVVLKSNIDNQEKKSSKPFVKKLLDLFKSLSKKFPANFFFLGWLISFVTGIYYTIIAVWVLIEGSRLGSYENWSGLIVLLYLYNAFYIYAVSAIFLIWSNLLRNLSIKDIVKKETPIIKRIFVFLSICVMMVVLFKSISFGYEWIYPQTRFYRENNISISNQKKDFKPCEEIESLAYGDKQYTTIQIGNQCWIKDNLNIGDMINHNDDAIIFDDKVQKHCYQDKIENCDTYGGLYSSYEAYAYSLKDGSQGICPDGWRIPTKNDIETLDVYLRCGAQGDDACAKEMTGKAKEAGFLNYIIDVRNGYFFHPGQIYDSPSIAILNSGNYNGNELFVKCIRGSEDDVLVYKPQLKGSGTSEDPYLITKLDDFGEVNKDLDASYLLTSDIDASITKTWENGEGFLPIGSESYFKGKFDGDNHVISNLYLANGKCSYVGLFSDNGSRGIIRNLKLTNVYISGIVTGGVAGFNDGLIENVSVQGEIDGVNDEGGIVGINASGTVRYSYADVSITGDIIIGGIAGSNGKEIRDSYALVNFKKINGREGMKEDTGLLVGDNHGNIYNSYVVANKLNYRKFNFTGNNEKNKYNSYAAIFYKEGDNIIFTGQGYDNASVGYSLAESDFYNKSTYKDWDFVNIWNEPTEGINDGYPTLKNRLIKDVIKPKDPVVKISAQAAIDKWGDPKIDLNWNKGDASYAIILSRNGDIPTFGIYNIVYYGTKDTLSISLEKNKKICFSIFGIDYNFKLIKNLTDSTCFISE